ncbi:MAG TPA: asparagine synthetase B, partial [Candidatus Brocadiaceae bacterium]
MCGIAGIIGKKRFSDNEISEYLVRLRGAIIHRGPDEEGEYIGKNCGFAHTRLSIVDIAGGHQPIFNDNKNTGIIYNGEVYNYLDLKKELEE